MVLAYQLRSMVTSQFSNAIESLTSRKLASCGLCYVYNTETPPSPAVGVLEPFTVDRDFTCTQTCVEPCQSQKSAYRRL